MAHIQDSISIREASGEAGGCDAVSVWLREEEVVESSN